MSTTKSEDPIPFKRLFIGGLYSGVAKDDLSSRFQAFGTVDDVDIHVKTSETGKGECG